MSDSAASSASSVRTAVARLSSDLRSLQADPPAGCSASPMSEDNLFVWNATVVGPDETAWEGGIFSIRLQFPDQYPMRPPKVRFTCTIFHPNGMCFL